MLFEAPMGKPARRGRRGKASSGNRAESRDGKLEPFRDFLGEALKEAILQRVQADVQKGQRPPSTKQVEKMSVKAIEKATDLWISRLRKRAPGLLRARARAQRGFERRLSESWASGFRSLELLQHVFWEFGAHFFRDGFREPHDP